MTKMLKSITIALSSQVSSSLLFAPTVQRTLLPSRQELQRRTLISLSAGKTIPAGKRRKGQQASSSGSSKRPQNKRPTRRSNSNNSNAKQKNLQQRAPNPKQFRLPEPTVVFTNNHLLFVNKPAGYHSQPNESIEQKPSNKCLLSKLKARELGGGSANNFLLPMHRLDQPCT